MFVGCSKLVCISGEINTSAVPLATGLFPGHYTVKIFSGCKVLLRPTPTDVLAIQGKIHWTDNTPCP